MKKFLLTILFGLSLLPEDSVLCMDYQQRLRDADGDRGILLELANELGVPNVGMRTPLDILIQAIQNRIDAQKNAGM